MEWPISPSAPEVLLAVAALLVMLVGLMALWSRLKSGRRRSPGPPPRRPQTPEPARYDLPKIVSNYRARYPAFFRIVADFQRRHSLDELLTSPDVERAFQRLAAGKPVQAFPSSRSYLQLDSRSELEIRAALLTIVRRIYEHQEFRRDLSPQTHLEIDRLLDTLTETT